MAAYTQLTHLFAARLSPGERELTDHDLQVIFGLSEVTAAIRDEIAEDLRAAGVEVLGLEPLLVRKPEPPPVEPAPPAPRSLRPWYIGAGGLVVALALAVMLPDGNPADAITRLPAPTPVSGTPRTHEPTLDIRPVEIAKTRTPKADLPCNSGRLRSKCERRTRGGKRRGR